MGQCHCVGKLYFCVCVGNFVVVMGGGNVIMAWLSRLGIKICKTKMIFLGRKKTTFLQARFCKVEMTDSENMCC